MCDFQSCDCYFLSFVRCVAHVALSAVGRIVEGAVGAFPFCLLLLLLSFAFFGLFLGFFLVFPVLGRGCVGGALRVAGLVVVVVEEEVALGLVRPPFPGGLCLEVWSASYWVVGGSADALLSCVGVPFAGLFRH